MRKNRTEEVSIVDMKYPNISIGETLANDKIEFKGGLLGQKVKVKITRNRSKAKKGKFLELIENSPLENSRNFCPVADICGGCAYQKLPYETELMLKLDMVKKLMKDHEIPFDGDISINRAPQVSAYRNKMEYTFGDSEKGGPLVLGLHRQNRFYEIVEPKSCNIVDDDFNNIRSEVQAYFRDRQTSFYHKSTRQGLLRHLIVRKAHRSNEIMVILVTTSDRSFDEIRKKLFVNFINDLDLRGNIVSIFHVINDSPADAVVVEDIDLLYGKDHIREVMMDLKFNISPFSFFQPNIYTAEKIYAKAIEFANINKDKMVLDLYSGTGTITQAMAKSAKKATGIEIVAEAVDKAIENAKLNDIANIDFLCGDVLEEIERIKGQYDVVILDPPRAGIVQEALEKILQLKPEKFVYISCNPKTQVNNLKEFIDHGYKILKYEVIDQFPKSRHVETIVLMSIE